MSAGNETYDAFISYSRADGRHAAQIDRLVRANGLKSFFVIRTWGCPLVRALDVLIGAAKDGLLHA
jgi:hypothetical protein